MKYIIVVLVDKIIYEICANFYFLISLDLHKSKSLRKSGVKGQ